MADERAHTTSGLKGVRVGADAHPSQRRRGVDVSPSFTQPIAFAHLPSEIGGIAELDRLIVAMSSSFGVLVPAFATAASCVTEQYDGTTEMVTGEIGGQLRNRVRPHRR
jgi:hypothetical protein